jgi:hypothetical protein
VLWAALAGIPLPLPQVAAVPLLRALTEAGMSQGAAMALLISGPVTSLPALALLSSIFQRPVLGLYLALGLLTALGFGLVLLAA